MCYDEHRLYQNMSDWIRQKIINFLHIIMSSGGGEPVGKCEDGLYKGILRQKKL